LADENLYVPIVHGSRDRGREVFSILEEGEIGSPRDEDVFRMAAKENRVILTMDKHIVNILRFPSNQGSGIIVVSLYKIHVDNATRLFFRFFDKLHEEQIEENLIIMTRKKLHIRRHD